MKKNELQKKSNEDLEKGLTEEREALRVARFEISGSKIRDVRKGRKIRKGIARILTELKLREKAPVNQS